MAELKNNYYQSVYDVTSLIPKGRVSTYGAIADYLSLGSARMVGWALNQVHTSDQDVPAHRVINRKGELSGRMHFQTPTIMQEKLEAEGNRGCGPQSSILQRAQLASRRNRILIRYG